MCIRDSPDSDRLTSSLVDAYKRGALQSGYDVRTIIIRDMEFNPNLKFGYKKRINLEPDLLMAIDEIKACEHMVWFHPLWWGSLPALLKGFIDRIQTENGHTKIIDYKTGGSITSSSLSFEEFNQVTEKKKKELFQLLCYSLIYLESNKKIKSVEPGLILLKSINSGTNVVRKKLSHRQYDSIFDLKNLSEFKLLVDELVEEIFEIVKQLNEKENVAFLLAEQNTNVALKYAHKGYILESGRVVMDGPAKELRENPDVKEFYLGLSGDKRKSYRDGRSYRRRKRWLN